MEFNQFNFSQPLWLWGLIAIPVMFLFYKAFHNPKSTIRNLEQFIDKDLIPHLLKNNVNKQKNIWISLALWSVMWAAAMVAMAGPRWDYTDVDTYTPDQSMVILLDVSQSMNAKDVVPSRMVRAHQEIEDILKENNGVKIGLVAFAADPHMIAPITDDMDTINNLLPSLNTDVVYVQGSILSPALEMAEKLLDAEAGNNKTILVVTDGGFEDGSAINTATQISKKGIEINTLGIGTEQGAPVADSKGELIKENGQTIISKLDEDRLRQVAQSGGGIYLKASYMDDDTKTILGRIYTRNNTSEKTEYKTRYWNERFYLLTFPIILLILFWFRRGYAFPIILICIISNTSNAKASEIKDAFKNSEQMGKYYLNNNEYDKAAEKFKDPYNRGVAEYKAGKFAEAEKSFRETTSPDVKLKSEYNLGNALAYQEKFDEAIKAYENVLKQQPDNKNAKDNLAIVKKLKEQQKQQKDENKDQKNKDSEKQDSKQSQSDNGKEDESKNNESQKDDDKADEKDAKDSKSQNGDEKQQADQQDNPEDKKDAQNAEQKDTSDEQKQDGTKDDNGQSEKKENIKTQKDIDADQWLNKVTNDPTSFLKNQFYIESKRNGTKAGNPW